MGRRFSAILTEDARKITYMEAGLEILPCGKRIDADPPKEHFQSLKNIQIPKFTLVEASGG